MNLDLTGKRALVCGSSKGIGKAAAIELALLGASITLVARPENILQENIFHLPADDTQAHNYIIADFSKPQLLEEKIQDFVREHPVDILVNNTGGPAGGTALGASVQEYLQAFTSHLIGNQLLTAAVTPAMKAAGWGRIINIISTSVKTPIKGLGVSNTIRAAVANWAKTLSFELGPHNITVNNVLPGFTMTDRLTELINARAEKESKTFEDVEEEMIKEIPIGRIGEAHEVAAAVAFLASPAAGYINGINFPVDGGKTPSL